MTKSSIKIREVSDLHLEHLYDLYDQDGPNIGAVKDHIKSLIPPMRGDKNTVLIVAGDLATARRVGRIVTFMRHVVPRFAHVIYVLGNHEHYQGCIATSQDIIVSALSETGYIDMSKLTIAGNDIVTKQIGDVVFHCGTLWTDYHQGRPETAFLVERFITDHKVIKTAEGGLFMTADAAAIHRRCVAQLDSLLRGKDNSKTVVATHHMPSYDAIADEYRFGDSTTRTLNAAFASDLNELIAEHQPAFWFFGHTHTKYDSTIQVGDVRPRTRLICNPHGYPKENNIARGNFNADAVYTL